LIKHTAALTVCTFSRQTMSFTNPRRESQRSLIWRAEGPQNTSLPSSYSAIRKLPVQKGNTNMAGEVRWGTIKLENCSQRDTTQSNVSFHFGNVNTECSALNDNKIEHYTPSTVKCIGEINTFSNTGSHRISYVLSRSRYGTISSTTHIKTIFSLSPGTDQHFIANGLCNSDDSVMQLVHILHFFMINNVFYKPRRKGAVNCGERGAREWVPLLLSNAQGTPCPERHKQGRSSEVVHHLTGNVFPRGHDAKHCVSIIASKVSPVTLIPSFSYFTPLDFFLLGACKSHCLSRNSEKCE